MVGKKRFAASEKRKAIRWLGARCVTGSEQAVGAVGAVTASEQSTTEAMEVEVVGTVAMAMSASSPRSPIDGRRSSRDEHELDERRSTSFEQRG